MFVLIFRDAVEFYMHQKLKNGFEIRSSVKNFFVYRISLLDRFF